MSHALLAIQNTLQNSNIFIRSRETVLFTPFGKKKATQFSGLLPISVSYLKLQLHDAIYWLRFYSNSLIHILSLSNSHNNVASLQKNRDDKSHPVIVALVGSSCFSQCGQRQTKSKNVCLPLLPPISDFVIIHSKTKQKYLPN